MTYEKIKSLLSHESLPHKFICAYALACAKDVFPLIKDKDLKQKALHCIDLTERWIKGEDIKAETLREASANATAYAAHAADSASAARAAHAASYAASASAASYAASAVSATHYATYATTASSSKSYEYYYNLLIKMIDENLSEVEKALIL